MVRFLNAIQKLGIFVRFSNGFTSKNQTILSGFRMVKPNFISKRPVFECFRFWNVRFSDPHFTEQVCYSDPICTNFIFFQSKNSKLPQAIEVVLDEDGKPFIKSIDLFL